MAATISSGINNSDFEHHQRRHNRGATAAIASVISGVTAAIANLIIGGVTMQKRQEKRPVHRP
ncbi:MAG: hypothetical protein ACOYIK_09640 [Coriobacteriales bacterium]